MDRKVVLITGGAMGQGKAHAIRFAENGFAHCESCGYRTDAKTLDMTERKECQHRSNNKTAYVERYLYLWVAYFGYLGKFSREKVGRSYRQTARFESAIPMLIRTASQGCSGECLSRLCAGRAARRKRIRQRS